MFEYFTSFFSSTPEPVCKAADLLCNLLEGYGYEVHSLDSLVDATQQLSDTTGLPVNWCYLTLAASSLAGAAVAAVGIYKYNQRGVTLKPYSEQPADIITPLSATSQTDNPLITEVPVVAVAVKPSLQAFVDKYTNIANKDAVAKMLPEVLAVFNTFGPAEVFAFGQKGALEMLRFNKQKPAEQIATLKALKPTEKSTLKM